MSHKDTKTQSQKYFSLCTLCLCGNPLTYLDKTLQIKSITYQSSTISYSVVGKGKTVVLLHGFGEDGEIWNEQINYLKEYFRLIIPDLPGSGRSEMIPDMSIEGISEVVKEILNIELQKFSAAAEAEGVIGHSMGGYITLAFAEKYPALLKAFGLVHSTAFADSEEKKLARAKSIEFIRNNGAYEFLKTSIPGLFKKPSDPYVNALIEKGKNFTPEALIQYYEAMIVRPDRTDLLKNFNGPVLFIIGEHDTAVPFQQSLQQCYLPGESQVHILRNSAHMGMQEEPGKMGEIVMRFLNDDNSAFI